jgi:hypothetical protein
MRGLFRPLEQYVGPSILTVGVPCFVVFWVVTLILFFFFEILQHSIRRTWYFHHDIPFHYYYLFISS